MSIIPERATICEHLGVTEVKDSRPTNVMGFKSVRRRRLCTTCGEKFTTFELNHAAITELSHKYTEGMIGKLRQLLERLENDAREE